MCVTRRLLVPKTTYRAFSAADRLPLQTVAQDAPVRAEENPAVRRGLGNPLCIFDGFGIASSIALVDSLDVGHEPAHRLHEPPPLRAAV
jgi:hypothetical protein